MRQPENGHALRKLLTIFLALGLVLTLGSPVEAAKDKKHTKKNFILSELVGRKLLKVSNLAEENRFAEAEAILEPLTKKTRLKKHDQAVIFQTYGLMLAAQEKYAESTVALERALDIDYLPESAMQSLRYNLAQLNMLDKQTMPRAIELLEEWMRNEDKPNAQAEFLLTNAYAQTEQWKEALVHGRRSVEISKEPVEQQLRLLLAVEYQNNNIPETLEILKKLVTHFPKKRYFMQLAAAYANAGQEENALAVLELAYQEGWLVRENEVLQLARRYTYHDLPWAAARTLQRGLDSGVVKPTADNLLELSNALLNAREYEKALEPLEKAAELSDTGDLYVRLAQVHLEVEDWAAARTALEAALAKGGLDKPGNVQLLLGITNFNEKRLSSARSAFNKALKDERTKKSARRWLEHVARAENERTQL